MGRVTVQLSEDKQNTIKNKSSVMMFSQCLKCGVASTSVTMQKDTYCLSFGKYLELRFHGHAYRCRDLNQDDTNSTSANVKPSINNTVCTHSLHRDHVQHFSYNGIVASFSYEPVEVWEISLPSLKIQLKIHQIKESIDKFTDEIKTFGTRGYEVFALIYDHLAQICDVESPFLHSLKKAVNNDSLAFRQKVGAAQAILSNTSLVYTYEINDAIFIMKKTLVDYIAEWTQRLADAQRSAEAQRSATKATDSPSTATPMIVTAAVPPTVNERDSYESHSIDSGTICTEDFRSDPESPMDASKSNVFLSREVSIDSENSATQKTSNSTDTTSNQITERDTKSSTSSDKKSVKTILRELLPSEKQAQPIPSPIPSSDNFSLPIGCVPVLVHDQDFSSVIAYCLASDKFAEKLSESPRKSSDAATDTEDSSSTAGNEKDKKSKSIQTHIEINFHDSTNATQFTCKVHFAREFDEMRMKVLSLSGSIDETDKLPFYRRHTSSDGEGKFAKDSADEKCDDGKKKEPVKMEKVRAAFIRSLSKSVRWEARGGKSGSKFCKTMGKINHIYPVSII